MWRFLSQSPEYQQVQEYIKATVLELYKAEKSKIIMNKIGELASEIASSIIDANRKDIWGDLFQTAKEMIAHGTKEQIESGINIYTETFRSMANDIVEQDQDLYAMFETTLCHEDININLSSLQAVAQLMCVVQPKHVPKFLGLMEPMVKVPMKALELDDESILEDALIEFNSIADSEPKFFKNYFTGLFEVFNDIIKKSSQLSGTIKHQPIEFLTTVSERQPSLLKENSKCLDELMNTVFQLMVDIDEDIDETWGDPKDPAQVKEEVEEDTVVFGKEVIDRLFSSVGEDIMLPLVCNLIEIAMQNKDDWRYKNAGLSAFSQVGEYVADIDQIKEMIPTVIEN